MKLSTPAAPIPRDRYGRPLVAPKDAGKPVPYTRVTTYISCIEDTYNLQKWMQRQVALGVASRPDLLLSVQAHRDNKAELDRICDAAREAAASSAAATIGTALHALTEALDRGEELPPLPAGATASIEAYRQALDGIKIRAIETFGVLDSLKVAGTADRILQIGKHRYIADIKTGSVDYGALKIAMQMAIYARCTPYTVENGRGEPTGADFQKGILIHLPATDTPGEARCELKWVDLDVGWNAVLLAKRIREARAMRKEAIYTDFATAPKWTLEDEWAAIRAAIDQATDPNTVREFWEPSWPAELVAYAKARVQTLEAS